MNPGPSVSIVIPWYDCPYVGIAISSALSQTWPSTEVVLVDDGSKAHHDRVRPYADRIRVVRKENGGVASALNAGIREARGEYVSWLSSDDEFYPWKTERQISFMLARGAVASCGPVELVDAGGATISIFSRTPDFHDEASLLDAMLGARWPINGCSLLIRKDVLEGAGPFDESIRYANDYDMWFRLIRNGVRMFLLDRPLVRYRRHDASGTVRFREQSIAEWAVVRQRHEGWALDRIRTSPAVRPPS